MKESGEVHAVSPNPCKLSRGWVFSQCPHRHPTRAEGTEQTKPIELRADLLGGLGLKG
jgi:hypothetical protein